MTEQEQKLRESYKKQGMSDKDSIKQLRDEHPFWDFAAGFIPGVGETQDVQDFYYGLKDKDYLTAGLSLVGLALPVVSGGQIRKGLKLIKKADLKPVKFMGSATKSKIHYGPERDLKIAERINLLQGNDGVYQKIVDPKINPQSMSDAADNIVGFIPNKYSNYPVLNKDVKSTSEAAQKLIEPNFYDTWYIPQRSKNKSIDIVANDIQSSKNTIKNYLQSKEYRKKIKAANKELEKAELPTISHKGVVQTANDNLDIVKSYGGEMIDEGDKGIAAIGNIGISESSGDSYTVLHELIHSSQQYGTPKKKFADLDDIYSQQNRVINYNANIINDRPHKRLRTSGYSKDGLKYYIDPQEMQAKIQPLQIMMWQNGWQPSQMSNIIETRGLDKNGQIKRLYKTFGEKNMEYFLKNMLKSGGKISYIMSK